MSNIDIALAATTSTTILAALARDPDEEVRLCVALNSSVTLKILDILSEDPVKQVRYRVAYHPDASEKTLRKLMDDFILDNDSNGFGALANNPSKDAAKIEIINEAKEYHKYCRMNKWDNSPAQIEHEKRSHELNEKLFKEKERIKRSRLISND